MKYLNLNVSLELTDEQAQEIQDHIDGKEESMLFHQIAEHLDQTEEIVPIYWNWKNSPISEEAIL